MKLSIAMIVKNEEKYLENTLKPLKELQKYIDSEIVIVDTGSTDKTIEIAKRYTDKIFFHKWNNNFSDMRNLSIGYCSGEWILIVDADEVLYDVKELVNLIKGKMIKDYNGAAIKIVNFKRDFEYSIENGEVCTLIRLFKKNSVRYIGSIHEQPKFHPPILETDIRFIHYGYDGEDYNLMEYKFKRNLDLLLTELNKNPNDIYINFQIAVSYIMHEDSKEALKYIEIAYEKAKSDIRRHVYVIDKYCFILYKTKQFELLLEKAQEGIKYDKDFIDFYFYLGEAHSMLKNYDSAIESYSMYIHYHDMLKKNRLRTDLSLAIYTKGFKDHVLRNLAICYFKNHMYEKAFNTVMKVKNTNDLKQNVNLLIEIIIEGDLWNRFHILNNYIDKYNYEDVLTFVHKNLMLEDLSLINMNLLEGKLKEIITITGFYKKHQKINSDILFDIKGIFDDSKIPYSIYVYYILKYDINEIFNLSIYGKDRLEKTLLKLSFDYYDFNHILYEGLKQIKRTSQEYILIRTIIEKALLYSEKLPLSKKKELFLSYIVDKYYYIINVYKSNYIKNQIWMLPEEDRFILEIKKILYYRYEDPIKYVRYMKDVLRLGETYAKFIKILIEEPQETLNLNLKSFVPDLVKGIKELIACERNQEAYETIEQGLKIVKFDFDLLKLKYELLIKFDFIEEASQCLEQIILYGDDERVVNLLSQIYN